MIDRTGNEELAGSRGSVGSVMPIAGSVGNAETFTFDSPTVETETKHEQPKYEANHGYSEADAQQRWLEVKDDLM